MIEVAPKKRNPALEWLQGIRSRLLEFVAGLLGVALVTAFYIILGAAFIWGSAPYLRAKPKIIVDVIPSTGNERLSAYKDTLCHEQSSCGKYKDVRQQCAIAGDFDNCVSVRMADEHVHYIFQCTNDGQIFSEEDRANMPNQVECFLRNAGLMPHLY
jgi:hypothetical protein